MDRQPRRIDCVGPSRRRDDHYGRLSFYLIDRTLCIHHQQQISLFYNSLIHNVLLGFNGLKQAQSPFSNS